MPEKNPELDASLIFSKIDRLCEQAKVLYNQTFAKFQAELTRYEGERMKLTLEADELRAIFTKKEEEFHGLRDRLEAVSRDRTHLTEQLEKQDVLIREELRARDTEILELKRHISEIASKRDTLQGKMVSARHQLHDARVESNKYKDLHTELVVVLCGARAKAEELISSYKDDVVTANAWAKKIERVKTLEEEAAALLASEGETSSGSEDDKDEGEIPEGEEAIEDPGAMARAVEGKIFEGAIEGTTLVE
ncbi:uncharacterized protein [Nicotiana sylvestris]|uniref:uncharacterized protein n=1 Tax=Nicotiana sylvestris TaxID=4096 RepID=UPI00388CA389